MRPVEPWACVLVTVCVLGWLVAPASGAPFRPVGLGGGGGLFTPSASPHDPSLMFVACDMSGLYRSEDAGHTWRMLDKRQMRSCISMGVVFHPTDPETCYGWGCGELRVSHDRGLAWQRLSSDAPWGGEPLTSLCVCRSDASLMLAAGGGGVYASADAGATWSAAAGISGRPSGVCVLPGGPVCVASTNQGVWRSKDRGATWQRCVAGLSATEVRALCGGEDAASGEAIVYCTVPSRSEGGVHIGGVFRSRDAGETWESAMGAGINRDIRKRDEYGVDEVAQYQFLGLDETHPRTVWATTRGTSYHPPSHWTVYRSDDAGETWRYTFTGDPRDETRNVACGWVALESSWGWGGPPLGFSVCTGNRDVAMYTNAGELFITTNGGQSWYNGFCRTADGGEEARGQTWVSSGLNVTSCWEVTFDPFRPGNVYIAYTDIGFARSEDRGQSWQHATSGSPWGNTCYRVICDPTREGVLYGAWSNQHDIPHWGQFDGPRLPGGVCISEDFGKTWWPLGEGLPAVPCTSVALDLRSPVGARVLYAAMYGEGVFRSDDGGATWQRASEGLGEKPHVLSVRLHPDGTLLCSLTARRVNGVFEPGSGLYRSSDRGRSWEPISSELDLRWAGDFAFDPTDSKVLYLTAATAPRYAQGGLYKTTDGGLTWQQLVGDGMPPERQLPQDLGSYVHAFFVTVDPGRPERVFLGATTHGLFVSEDGGESWQEVTDIPFQPCQRVTVDPADPETIWTTTFGGGVWVGKPDL